MIATTKQARAIVNAVLVKNRVEPFATWTNHFGMQKPDRSIAYWIGPYDDKKKLVEKEVCKALNEAGFTGFEVTIPSLYLRIRGLVIG